MESKTITFGGGCFWCTEAIFRETPGVLDIQSGFSGGFIKNPPYREVRTGRTGHAEVIRVSYDPGKVSLEDLLTIHLATHDPTTTDRQGADKGSQYRSIILYGDEQERLIAEHVISVMAGAFPDPIVTELKPFEAFYKAEEEHQNYYRDNPDAFYCQAVHYTQTGQIPRAP